MIRSSLKIREEREILADGYRGMLLINQNGDDRAMSAVLFVEKEENLYYFAGWGREFEKIISSIKFNPPKF